MLFRSSKNVSLSAGTEVGRNEGQRLKELKYAKFTVSCMKEEGFNILENKRKQLTKEMVDNADKVICMVEEYPTYLENNKVTFWHVADPYKHTLEFTCQIKDQIRKLVENLVEEIG